MSSSKPDTITQIPFNPLSTFDNLIYQLFDYAGMFPPAQRDFDSALHESASLSSSLTRPWLSASDLVLDTPHTRKLVEASLAKIGFKNSLSLCVLANEDEKRVEATLASLSKTSLPITISSIEVKIPDDSAASAINSWGKIASQYGAMLALEPDLSRVNWEAQLTTCVTVISDAHAKVALKCRLTGPTGIEAQKLARAICEASDAGIHLKVTGGLHHPIVDAARHNYPMGFVNVAAAVMLRRSLGPLVSETALTRLLTNSSWNSLGFENGLQFESYSASFEQIIAAKRHSHFSIGSCSLHEPDADLLTFSDTAR